MTQPPKVSVIVPNYNHAPYLRERIDSILAQTMQDFELILLDDHSTDSSRDILESYRDNPHVSAIVCNETNTGSPFSQWEKGLGMARGEYVWIAESDDCATSTFLESLVPLLDGHPEAALAFSGSIMIDSESKPIEDMDWDRYHEGAPRVEFYSSRDLILKKLLYTAYVYNASMVLFRRSMAPAITAEQKKMRYCGDWLFWQRLARNGSGIELREKLNRFRQHNAKVSPGASSQGLYFREGLKVMSEVADALDLSPRQRNVLAGRTWKRLGKFEELMKTHGDEVMANLDAIAPGSSLKSRRLIALYTADKYLNFSKLNLR